MEQTCSGAGGRERGKVRQREPQFVCCQGSSFFARWGASELPRTPEKVGATKKQPRATRKRLLQLIKELVSLTLGGQTFSKWHICKASTRRERITLRARRWRKRLPSWKKRLYLERRKPRARNIKWAKVSLRENALIGDKIKIKSANNGDWDNVRRVVLFKGRLTGEEVPSCDNRRVIFLYDAGWTSSWRRRGRGRRKGDGATEGGGVPNVTLWNLLIYDKVGGNVIGLYQQGVNILAQGGFTVAKQQEQRNQFHFCCSQKEKKKRLCVGPQKPLSLHYSPDPQSHRAPRLGESGPAGSFDKLKRLGHGWGAELHQDTETVFLLRRSSLKHVQETFYPSENRWTPKHRKQKEKVK